jgi:hypothetical protein
MQFVDQSFIEVLRLTGGFISIGLCVLNFGIDFRKHVADAKGLRINKVDK